MRIHVVDDDPTVRRLVAMQLEMAGHLVTDGRRRPGGLDALAARLAAVMILRRDDAAPQRLARARAAGRGRAGPAAGRHPADSHLPHDRQRARELGAALLAKPHHGQVVVDLVQAVGAGRAVRLRSA